MPPHYRLRHRRHHATKGPSTTRTDELVEDEPEEDGRHGQQDGEEERLDARQPSHVHQLCRPEVKHRDGQPTQGKCQHPEDQHRRRDDRDVREEPEYG